MAESSPNGWKTLREKEKLLVTSNFSFSPSVLERLVLQTRKNKGLFGKDVSQPAQSLQADMGQNLQRFANFLKVKGPL